MKDLYIIFGPPGSGKTVQCVLLANMLHLDQISWGQISRDPQIKEKYRSRFDIIESGIASEEERAACISYIIETEMAMYAGSDNQGLVMDGFPRNHSEALKLYSTYTKYGYKLKSLIRINPSFETCLQRYKELATCKNCGRIMQETLVSTQKFCYDGKPHDFIEQSFNKDVLSRDFLAYLQESKHSFEYLSKYAQSYFTVSGDFNDITVFSDILIKLRDNIRQNYQIYTRKSYFDNLATEFGVFKIYTYQSRIDYSYHIALVKGDVTGKHNVVTRVHSSCITGDIFGSERCDCGPQLHEAMKTINSLGEGIILYLFQEGRGINIINKMQAYKLQDKGYDTVEANEMLKFPAELRQYDAVCDMLNDLEVASITLLTNNPDKIEKITDTGVVVSGISPLQLPTKEHNKKYLETKKQKMRHRLSEIQ